jgi:acetolactate synthase I/II/III large subunit
MKVSDYVAQFLVEKGIRDVFLASGGGIMHLLDSVGRHPGLRYYCNYHEQACAVAAEGYARMTGRPGACFVTTGPGAANALSGIMAAWVDSVPLIVISGQVRTDLIADYKHVRQVGPQEGNAIAMAVPVTKYVASVRDASRVRYELERAYWEATSGRPGPAWIEFPLDIQAAMIDETKLEGFTPPAPDAANKARMAEDARRVIDVLQSADRPVIIPGNGIHYSDSRDLLRRLIEITQVPVLLPLTAKDLVPENHPLQMGVIGGTGQRRANFAVQNSDCILALSAGLNVQKIGFNVKGFAPKAKKIIVDIDPGQLTHQILKPDIAICAEVHAFLTEMLRQLEGVRPPARTRWLEACANWRLRYPLMTQDYYQDPDHVNTYVFMDTLSNALQSNDVLVTGNGTEVVSYYQVYKIKEGQRTINTGWGSMGWDLPNAIGACIGNQKKRTICVCGDGSIQWNIQELLTIRKYGLPIKIFVFNNRGYASIRSTQTNFFDSRFVGADASSGVVNPDFRTLAKAYGISYTAIENAAALQEDISRTLLIDGPVLCEVNVSFAQGVSPKASAFRREDGTLESRPLEDMAPFLPREEVLENMRLFDDEELITTTRHDKKKSLRLLCKDGDTA